MVLVTDVLPPPTVSMSDDFMSCFVDGTCIYEYHDALVVVLWVCNEEEDVYEGE